MPTIEVPIVARTAAPTGVGEPGVPPPAPAVANAVAKLGGPRVRRLPLTRWGWSRRQAPGRRDRVEVPTPAMPG